VPLCWSFAGIIARTHPDLVGHPLVAGLAYLRSGRILCRVVPLVRDSVHRLRLHSGTDEVCWLTLLVLTIALWQVSVCLPSSGRIHHKFSTDWRVIVSFFLEQMVLALHSRRFIGLQGRELARARSRDDCR